MLLPGIVTGAQGGTQAGAALCTRVQALLETIEKAHLGAISGAEADDIGPAPFQTAHL
jgi:hypothetical protein